MSTKQPWSEYPQIWKTKSAFMSFIRGGIRRGLWEKNPIKLQFIKDNRQRVPLGKQTEKNPEGLVWGGQCNICKELFKQSALQVDHLSGENSLKDIDDIQTFIENIVLVSESDLQLVCKRCHKLKGLCERRGITLEEGMLEQKVIEFGKKKVDEQKKILLSLNPKANVSNAEVRRNEYRNLLIKGEIK